MQILQTSMQRQKEFGLSVALLWVLHGYMVMEELQNFSKRRQSAINYTARERTLLVAVLVLDATYREGWTALMSDICAIK